MLDTELIKRELIGKTFVSHIYYFDEISSTNDFAKECKKEDNILVIAEYQSAGRGRFDRKWENEKYKNLTFTLKKRFGLGIENSIYINFFSAFFLYSAIKKFIEGNFPELDSNMLEVKWPNDILFYSKKICGILIESLSNGKEFFIGVGINVNQSDFKNLSGASSLSRFTNAEIERSPLLIEIMKEIDNNLHLLNYDNLNEIYVLWKSSTKMIGRHIDFDLKGISYKSIQIIDLPIDGTIELLMNGSNRRFTNSELSFISFVA